MTPCWDPSPTALSLVPCPSPPGPSTRHPRARAAPPCSSPSGIRSVRARDRTGRPVQGGCKTDRRARKTVAGPASYHASGREERSLGAVSEIPLGWWRRHNWRWAGRPPSAVVYRPLPPAARAYVAGLAALAVLLLAAWWSVRPSLPDGAALVMPLFTAATAVALLFPLRLGQGRDMTVAAAPDFAALLLLGPAAALVTAGVGTLVANSARAWQGRRNRWDICFNTG